MDIYPVTYLVTFTCYGCHLHGQLGGSVDRAHNLPGSRLLDEDRGRCLIERRRMEQPPYSLDAVRLEAVLASIRDRCPEMAWRLLAAHVRATHIHLVVEAEAHPNRIMNDLKSYSSRCLNAAALDPAKRKRWTRHGSTRWLWTPESISAAVRYVVDEQGAPMAVYASDE